MSLDTFSEWCSIVGVFLGIPITVLGVQITEFKLVFRSRRRRIQLLQEEIRRIRRSKTQKSRDQFLWRGLYMAAIGVSMLIASLSLHPAYSHIVAVSIDDTVQLRVNLSAAFLWLFLFSGETLLFVGVASLRRMSKVFWNKRLLIVQAKVAELQESV